MSLKTKIIGASSKEYGVEVDERNALKTFITTAPLVEVGEPSRFRYLSQLLSSVGDGTGTTNQSVNGGVTAQEFIVTSNINYDIRIMEIAIVLTDATVINKEFGGSGVLSNGWSLEVEESGEITEIILAATTLGEVLIQSNNLIIPAAASTQANVIGEVNVAGDASFVCILDIQRLIPGGMRIGRGTVDRLVSTVSDNLSANSVFTQRVLGYKHYP